MKLSASLVLMLCTFIAGAQTPAPDRVRDARSKVQPNNPMRLTVWNDKLYFYASTDLTGNELWVYTSPQDTVKLVFDTNPGPVSCGAVVDQDRMVHAGGKLCFQGNISNPGQVTAEQMFEYDGTAQPRLSFILGDTISGAQPMHLTPVTNKVYFIIADRGLSGINLLYTYDGTTATRISDSLYTRGYTDAGLATVNDKLYFLKDTDPARNVQTLRLMELDPHTEAITVVSDLNAGSGRPDPQFLTAGLGRVFYTATSTTHGSELYCYDGRTTTRLSDVNPGTASSTPVALWPFKGRMYFTAVGAGSKRELYSWDSSLGVSKVATPAGMAIHCVPGRWADELGGEMYFIATTPASGAELWRFDGTQLRLVADLIPGTVSGALLTKPVVFKNHIYFSGRTGTSDKYELYRVSAAGTGVQKAVWRGELNMFPNPTSSNVHYRLELPAPQQLRISLSDMSGRVVAATAVDCPAGSSSGDIRMDTLPPGQYAYQLSDAGSNILASGLVTKQ